MTDDRLRYFREFKAKLDKCKRPEDFFGDLPGSPRVMIDLTRKKLAPIYMRYHPDRLGVESGELFDVANDIMCALSCLDADAEKKILAGTYGKPDEPVATNPLFEIKTRKQTYRVMRNIGEGDIARLYAAEYDTADGTGTVCIKICQDPSDNPLLLREIEFLRSFAHKQVPVYVESFFTTDRQQAVVMQLIDGFDVMSLREMPLYAKGIPLNHACWIMERSLSVLGNMHRNTVTIHGDITPWHLMVRPFDHKVFLVDFTYSAKDGGNYCLPATETYSAPEISDTARPSPRADIFALGKTMIYLLGGDPATNRVPKNVDRRIIDLLGDMINQNPERRAGDAWALARRLSDLRLEIYGNRHGFIPFATG